jgi:hypothetical protein
MWYWRRVSSRPWITEVSRAVRWVLMSSAALKRPTASRTLERTWGTIRVSRYPGPTSWWSLGARSLRIRYWTVTSTPISRPSLERARMEVSARLSPSWGAERVTSLTRAS